MAAKKASPAKPKGTPTRATAAARRRVACDEFTEPM
jgi:hypothetical protein